MRRIEPQNAALFAALFAALLVAPSPAEALSLGRQLQQNKRQFLPCYKGLLKKQPKLAGRMVLRFQIDASGRVSGAKLLRDTTGSKALRACVLKIVVGWRFGASARARKVNYPITFSPGPPPGIRKIKYGRLSKKAIQAVIRKQLQGMKACYERALKSEPRLRGKVVLGFTIAANGRVHKAKVKRSSMKHPKVEACLLSQARTWRFPRPKGGGIVRVSYPFTFTP